jgi:hypothetical protein
MEAIMGVESSVEPIKRVVLCIHEVRGQKVILDFDLARIYGVTTARLNQQVKRNQERFPKDFVFQLTKDEYENLMLQIATSSPGYGGRRKLPYAFTEHGAIMAATVLNSPQAVQMSLFVVRAFVKMRDALASHRELARKLEALEKKYDTQFKVVFEAIRQLMAAPEPPRRPIGFGVRERRAEYRVRKRATT